jgi:hypothetical protein
MNDEIVALLEALPRPRGTRPEATVVSVDLDRDTVVWSDGTVTDLFAHRHTYVA